MQSLFWALCVFTKKELSRKKTIWADSFSNQAGGFG